MLKAVLWDNDGVLVDTEPLYFAATREVLASAGVDLRREDFIRLSLQQGRSVFDLLADRDPDGRNVERLRAERNQRYTRLLEERVAVRDGVRECLRRLHGRVSMGIVTSSRREHFDTAHRSSGLRPFFDFVLTREDYESCKPDPEPYLTAAARHGWQPSECIVVEDSERGLLAARRAGMTCIVAPTELSGSGDFDGAARVVASLDEVAEEILRRLGTASFSGGRTSR